MDFSQIKGQQGINTLFLNVYYMHLFVQRASISKKGVPKML